jgi:hydroxyacylglutathione hydrolase
MSDATTPIAGLEDDWCHVEPRDERSFTIGEPRYHQQNWSYLLVGDDRSLLFDTGSYFGDIAPVVERRRRGPLTALPSHMHYDHLGNVTRFDHVALPDLPILRECANQGRMTPSDQLFLGKSENRTPPTFDVAEWVAIGDWINLGNRRVQLLHTPGHSPDSVSLWEPDRNRLFAADFLYCGALYAQTPSASLAAYLASSKRLRTLIDDDTAIYGAHGAALPGDPPSPPRLCAADVTALISRLDDLRRKPTVLKFGGTRTVEISPRMQLIFGVDALKGFAFD